MSAIQAEIPYLDTSLDRIEVSFESRSFDHAIQQKRLAVRDGRTAQPTLSLQREGFQIAVSPSAVVRERRAELIQENSKPREDLAPVNAAYMDELVSLIERLSAAREVFAQYDTITVRFSERARERSWMSTAAFAHIDFQRADVERIFRQTLELTGRSVRPFTRYVVFQTWRVITPPPQDRPLALCDARTISAEELVDMDFHGPKGSRNELVRSLASRHGARHEWYFFPDMTPDEVLIFKGFDSSAAGGAWTPLHTAFDHPDAERAEPRGSVECRFFALYD